MCGTDLDCKKTKQKKQTPAVAEERFAAFKILSVGVWSGDYLTENSGDSYGRFISFTTQMYLL